MLDKLSDRALAFLAAAFFAALGLDILIIDAIPFIDEAVLATVATGLATGVLSRRSKRKKERLAEAEAEAEAQSAEPPAG